MSNLNINNIPRPFSLPGQQQLNNNDGLPQVNDVNAVENQKVSEEKKQQGNWTPPNAFQNVKPHPASWLKQLNGIMETATQKVSGIFSYDKLIHAINAEKNQAPLMKSGASHVPTNIGEIPIAIKAPAKHPTSKNNIDVLPNKLSSCAVQEANVNGADPTMVDANLDDKNLATTPKMLGKGGANTVYLCSYRIGEDIKEYVFKPEYQAKHGNTEISLEKQTIANLNHASYKCAKLLGLGNRITKSNVGTLQGTYGIFMEKAQGGTPEEISVTQSKEKKINNCLNFSELDLLKQNEPMRFRKIKGQLMQQLNQLQWMDLLTGQSDRHCQGYKIKIDDNDNVTVKGIDNDMAFPAWRIGLTKVKFSAQKLKALKESVSWEEYQKYLVPGNNDNEVILDFDKMPPQDVQKFINVLGLPNVKIPDCIDEDLKNSFLDLQAKVTQNPETLKEVLGKNLPAVAIEQLKGRLQEICDMLNDPNKISVIKKDDWTKAQTQLTMDQKYQQDYADLQNANSVNKFGFYPGLDIFYRDLGFLAEVGNNIQPEA